MVAYGSVYHCVPFWLLHTVRLWKGCRPLVWSGKHPTIERRLQWRQAKDDMLYVGMINIFCLTFSTRVPGAPREQRVLPRWGRGRGKRSGRDWIGCPAATGTVCRTLARRRKDGAFYYFKEKVGEIPSREGWETQQMDAAPSTWVI